jgi:hypothetical protein
LPRRHIIRKLIPGYRAIYTTKDGQKVVVTSLSPLPKKRRFKVAGGIRTFTRVSYKKQLQEVIIVAKSTKKPAKSKKTVTDDELEELDGLEELDELEDEDEDEDEVEEDEPEDEDEDEDEDDDDEEPAPKKAKKAAKPRQSRAAADGMVGTQELAADLDVTPRELRMVLRKLREKDDVYSPDSETGRYQWKSLKDKQVLKIKKAIESGLHKTIRDEALQVLKDKKAAEKAASSNDASAKTKKNKKKKTKKVVDDDE